GCVSRYFSELRIKLRYFMIDPLLGFDHATNEPDLDRQAHRFFARRTIVTRNCRLFRELRHLTRPLCGGELVARERVAGARPFSGTADEVVDPLVPETAGQLGRLQAPNALGTHEYSHGAARQYRVGIGAQLLERNQPGPRDIPGLPLLTIAD